MTWRYLAVNHGSEGPRHIFSVDTETLREPHPTDDSYSVERLRMGVVRYCRLDDGRRGSQCLLPFRSSDEFWRFVERHASPRSMNWVFAHGIGFDLRVLGWQQRIDSGQLLLRRWRKDSKRSTATKISVAPETGLLVLDGVPTIVECWLQNGSRLRLVDTRNWWHCKLAEIGEAIGLPKLAMPDPWESEETWLTYCARDCEIVEEAAIGLLNWSRQHDLGTFKPTAAGQAMQAYRHRFHHRKIVLHDAEEIKRLEREAYYAGRLDLFYVGKIEAADRGVKGMLFDKFAESAPSPSGVVYKLDVNGLFPSVMRGNLFPRKLVRWNTNQSDSPRTFPDNMASMVATVWLKNASGSYPVRRDGKVRFAGGSFLTTLAGPELSRARRSGSIQAVESWAAYELDELFTEYVEFFQELRNQAKQDGRTLEARLCKMLLNSLYGKFAQRSFEWETLPRVHPPEPWSNWCQIDLDTRQVREFRAIGELVQLRQDRGDHPNSFVAISAFVTAYARLRMDGLREIAGPHNVYYQGVDSLYVSELGLERLTAAGEVDGQQLGKLRLEGESRDTQFLARGIYRFAGQWTRTSVRGNAQRIDDLEFVQDQFQSLAESVNHPPLDGVAVRSIHHKLCTDPTDYDLTPAGWVRPLRFDECESSLAPFAADCSCDQYSLENSCLLGSGIP